MKRQPMRQKLIGFLILIIGVFLTIYSYDAFVYEYSSPQDRLKHVWKKDLKTLKKSKTLPKGWNQIARVKYSPLTPLAKIWMKKFPPLIPTTQKGQYLLEVSIIDWKEAGSYGVIINYNLYSLKTGDKVWEFGRTFKLGKLKRKKRKSLKKREKKEVKKSKQQKAG